MHKRRFQRIAVTSVALFMMMPLWASVSIPNGWYVEGNLGTTKLTDSSYPQGASWDVDRLGGNVNFGYKFAPYFSGELGYTRYGNVTINDSSGTKAGTDKHYAFDIAGKGIFPITESALEVFGKIGMASLNSHIDITNSGAASAIGLNSGKSNHIGLYLGVGVEYYFFSQMGVNLQWMRASGDGGTGTLQLISLGVSYIFG